MPYPIFQYPFSIFITKVWFGIYVSTFVIAVYSSSPNMKLTENYLQHGCIILKTGVISRQVLPFDGRN